MDDRQVLGNHQVEVYINLAWLELHFPKFLFFHSSETFGERFWRHNWNRPTIFMHGRSEHDTWHYYRSCMPPVIHRLILIAGLHLLMFLPLLNPPAAAPPPGPGEIDSSSMMNDIIFFCGTLHHQRYKLWGDERTMWVLICSWGFQPILAGSSLFLSFPLDIPVSFVTASPTDFRLQHQTQKV